MKIDGVKELNEAEGMCKLKVGEIIVELIYAENNKSFKKCMLNILKEKIK